MLVAETARHSIRYLSHTELLCTGVGHCGPTVLNQFDRKGSSVKCGKSLSRVMNSNDPYPVYVFFEMLSKIDFGQCPSPGTLIMHHWI